MPENGRQRDLSSRGSREDAEKSSEGKEGELGTGRVHSRGSFPGRGSSRGPFGDPFQVLLGILFQVLLGIPFQVGDSFHSRGSSSRPGIPFQVGDLFQVGDPFTWGRGSFPGQGFRSGLHFWGRLFFFPFPSISTTILALSLYLQWPKQTRHHHPLVLVLMCLLLP